jgi:hypothetical protein
MHWRVCVALSVVGWLNCPLLGCTGLVPSPFKGSFHCGYLHCNTFAQYKLVSWWLQHKLHYFKKILKFSNFIFSLRTIYFFVGV